MTKIILKFSIDYSITARINVTQHSHSTQPTKKYTIQCKLRAGRPNVVIRTNYNEKAFKVMTVPELPNFLFNTGFNLFINKDSKILFSRKPLHDFKMVKL